MADVISYIAVINTFFEMMCIIAVSESIFDKKIESKLLVRVGILWILLCAILVNLFNVHRFLLMFDCFFIMMYMIKLGYHIKVMDALLYTVFSIVVAGALELIIYIPLYSISLVFFDGKDVSLLVVILAFSICYIMKQKSLLFEWKKLIYKWKGSLYFGFLFLIIIVIYAMNSMKFTNGFLLSEGIYILTLAFVIIGSMYKISIYNMELDLNKKYSEKYSEVIHDIKARQHKFMNQLNSIYMLTELYGTYDELVYHQKKEIENLGRYMMPNKILILERPLLIAHIYNKLCEAEEKNIHMQIEISCSMCGINVPDIYLIEIMGNLLDNALDEVSNRNLDESIYFSIFPVKDAICISVSNEHAKIPYHIYKQFFVQGFSSKGDKRGLGLPYVKNIVDRYGGSIEIGNVERFGKNLFCIKVFLKKYEI